MMRPPIRSVLLPTVTRRRALALGALGAAMTVSARHARRAGLPSKSTGGNFQPMPIAIPEFIPVTGGDADTAHGITQIITANLQRSGLFVPIDPAAFIEKITNLDAQPNFQSWRSINAQALIVGRFSRQPDGRYKAEFRLWDVLGGQPLGNGRQYVTTPENWRRLAHIISDAVYERITGEKGYFDSHIVFVDETGPKERRVKRLAIMDQDGANVRYLTRGEELVLTPRFSPTSPGNHLHGLRPGRSARLSPQHRVRRARDRRQFSRHELFAAVFAEWSRRHHEPAGRLECQHLCDGLGFEGDDAADQYGGNRYVALLLAGRFADMFRI